VITFVPLLDRAEFIPLVAQWNWDEWGELLPERSAAEYADYLRREMRRDGIPIAYLALDDGLLVGTVSLLPDDLEIRPEITPWLAALYVVPGHRRRGLGRRLVAYAVEAARSFGVGTLYLYTPGQAAFYRPMQWELVEETEFRGRAITIMKRRLADADFKPSLLC
jgi:GNAT superfamily N-acetyltransferase